MPRLLVGVFHPDIDFCVHTFGLCLGKKRRKKKREEINHTSVSQAIDLLPFSVDFHPLWPPAHHAGQREQRGLDLGHVSVFKEVIGLEDVARLQAVGQDGFDEIPKVFQLRSGGREQRGV